jgi:uncharacterized protein YjlB
LSLPTDAATGALPLPAFDPVTGRADPLLEQWRPRLG